MPSPLPRYRDLIDAALSGQPVPICPVFAHRHHPHADQEGVALAEATVAFHRRFDFDLMKLTPASTWQLRDYGVTDADDPGDPLGRRRITGRPITGPGDWRSLPQLDPHQGFTARMVRAAALTKRSADSAPVLVTVYGPVSLAAKLAGADRLAADRRDHPEAVAAGLRVITENTCRTIRALADTGVDGVFLAVQTAHKTATSAPDYAAFGLPGDLACLAAAGDMRLTILHLHGIGIHADLFAGRPASVLHFDASPGNPAPQSLRQSGIALPALSTGPSPGGCLSSGTADQTFAEAQAWVSRFGGSRFILAPGCTVPLGAPDANLEALVAAARVPLPQRLA